MCNAVTFVSAFRCYPPFMVSWTMSASQSCIKQREMRMPYLFDMVLDWADHNCGRGQDILSAVWIGSQCCTDLLGPRCEILLPGDIALRLCFMCVHSGAHARRCRMVVPRIRRLRTGGMMQLHKQWFSPPCSTPRSILVDIGGLWGKVLTIAICLMVCEAYAYCSFWSS